MTVQSNYFDMQFTQGEMRTVKIWVLEKIREPASRLILKCSWVFMAFAFIDRFSLSNITEILLDVVYVVLAFP